MLHSTSLHGFKLKKNYVYTNKVKVKVLVPQSSLNLCDPMDCSSQAPLFVGFPRQEYWNG